MKICIFSMKWKRLATFAIFSLVIAIVLVVRWDTSCRCTEELTQLRNKLDDYERNRLIMTSCKGDKNEDRGYKRKIPRSRSLNRLYRTDKSAMEEITMTTTVLMYYNSDVTACLISQVKNVQSNFPDITIIIATRNNLDFAGDIIDSKINILQGEFTEGKALNIMINLTNTEFFLYLSRGATISDFDSDNGPGWLYHALLSVPEVDFVGGAYLWYNSSLAYMQYETQCYRLKMCQWVFSQTYEYQYSVGDMMICEETSPSFMGRTASVRKVGGFDPDLTDMALTDFFWRGKSTLVVALRPEVYFTVTKTCSKSHPSNSGQTSSTKNGFMDKYDLREVRDSYGRVTSYSLRLTPPRDGFDHYKDGGVMTPTDYKTLVDLLSLADDFYKMHNVTYFVEAGVALGAIKMRSILPWDGVKDIDTAYYGVEWNVVKEMLHDFCGDCRIYSRPSTVTRRDIQQIEVRRPYRQGMVEFDTHEFQQTPPANDFLYVFVNGRDIPVKRNFIADQRQSYGFRYLQTRHRNGELMRCRKPGHHACVPDEFAAGGGYWSDFFCQK